MKKIYFAFSTAICAVVMLVCAADAGAQALRPGWKAMPKTQQAVAKPLAIGSSAADYDAITDWQSIGKGRYTDGFVAWTVGDTGYEMDPWEVEIEESASNPGLFRLVNPYEGCSYATYYYEVDLDSTYYMIVDATNPEAVFIPEFATGVRPYYAGSGSEMTYGRSDADGTYSNYEITFPSFGLACRVESSDTWTASNNDENFHIYLPGATDYSATMTPGSMCVEEAATADLTCGADITYVRYAFALYGEADPEFSEPTSLPDNSLSLSIPVTAPGKYLLTVRFYSADDEVKSEQDAAFFKIENNDEKWVSHGLTSMTEGFAEALFGSDYGPNTYDVEFQSNVDVEGFYRIVNPMEGNTNESVTKYNYHSLEHAHYIFIHAEDPNKVYLEESPIGLDMGYGDMAIQSQTDVYGYMEDGKITFPLDAVAMWADEWKKRVLMPFKSEFVVTVPASAAIDSVTGDKNQGPAEYFNLQGVKVSSDNLVPGFYILRQGSKVTKVYVEKK